MATASDPRGGSSLHGTSASAEELRLVLLGTLGCGKTASADTILGQAVSATRSSSSFGSSTRVCQRRRGVAEGREVTVVEAPRLYWNGRRVEDSVRKETRRVLQLTAPGPHAFLLLIPVCQFTEVEGRVPAEMKELFGPEVLNHTLVLLTCGDYLAGQTEEMYLQGEDPGLKEVIGHCGGRYHIINNRRRHDRQQVRALLDKVDNMVAANGGHYGNTGPQRGVDDRATPGKQRLDMTETPEVAEKEEKDTVESNTPVSVRKTRRRERPRPLHDDGLDAEYSSAIDSSVSDQLNAVDGAILQQISVKPKINTTRQRIGEHSSKTSPTDSSSQSPVSYSSSRLPPSSSSRLPPSSPSSSSRLPPSSPSSSSRLPPSSPSRPPSSSPELRLVLLGNAGVGKSTAGNGILGKEEFETRQVTLQCEKRKALVPGRKVAVIDTPDWFRSESSPEEVRAQISSCVALSSPGPHAFLLCVPLDRPARVELHTLAVLEAVFGEGAVRTHTLLLFTRADRLRADAGEAVERAGGVEAYIAAERWDLLKLVEKCGDRYHVLEGGAGAMGPEERRELLEKVEQTVREAGGGCYSCPAFREAEERVRRRQKEIANERKGRGGGRADPAGSPRISRPDLEDARDEAEWAVGAMPCLESLPPITASTLRPSLMSSLTETMESTAKWIPTWSLMWEKVRTGGKDVQKFVADSSMWEKVTGRAGGVSAVRSRAKMVADSAVWEKAKSGAKLVSDGSRSLAQSPIWGQVGSGAKTGAKMMAGGARKVAQSPVWGKMGTGAKAGVKMVAESSIWEEMASGAKKLPKVVAGGAVLGLLLGVLLGGVLGGAVGAAAGSLVTEVGRRKFSKDRNSVDVGGVRIQRGSGDLDGF